MLANSAINANLGGVQVVIGDSEGLDELKECSMVLAKYGIPDQVTGTLGVLGPMRMSYSRAIPIVRYMADVLSNLMIHEV